MKKNILLLIILLSCMFLVSCDKSSTNTKSQSTFLQAKIDDLNMKYTSLQNQINKLSKNVSDVQNGLFLLQTNYLMQHLAMFTPQSAGGGFVILNSNAGNFLIVLDSINKYANGYKVTFSIGNPNMATFSNVSATIHWGREYNKDENYFTWYKDLQSMSKNITTNIYPGVWNKVSFIVSPATSAQTGYIDLSLQVKGVLLETDYRR